MRDRSSFHRVFGTIPPWMPALCGLTIAAGTVSAQDDETPADASVPHLSKPIIFEHDIAPIFFARCVQCHGPEQQRDSLRLDLKRFAELGGASGRPISGGTLETNEVYRRVSSHDAAYRMPKGAPALSDHEVLLIANWVRGGAQWPNDPPSRQPIDASTNWLLRAFHYVDAAVVWLERNPYSAWFQWGGLAALVGTLLVERRRQALNELSEEEREFAWGGDVRAQHIVAFWVVFAVAFMFCQQRGDVLAARRESARLQESLTMYQARLDAATPSTLAKRYGDPPVPPRLRHPRATSRTYYRGNCERNIDLFNGGNYSTCQFHATLAKSDGDAIQPGDAYPSDGLTLRFRITRSPGATPSLYEDDMMRGVLLSCEPTFKEVQVKRGPWRLAVESSGECWTADPTLAPPDAMEGKFRQVFYVVKGSVGNMMVRGDMHYAVVCDLELKDGRFTDQTDVWMGSLFTPPNIIQPDDSRIPFCEWFDWRPLPEIQGENTKDPKLLGILDHRPAPPTAPSPSTTNSERETNPAPSGSPPSSEPQGR